MARSPKGPNTAGSQFFICVSPQPHLDSQYTVFGEILNLIPLADEIIKKKALCMGCKNGTKGNPSVEAQTMFAKLKKVSNSKLLMQMGANSSAVFAECDKQTIPPISPTLDNVTQIPATSDSGYRAPNQRCE